LSNPPNNKKLLLLIFIYSLPTTLSAHFIISEEINNTKYL